MAAEVPLKIKVTADTGDAQGALGDLTHSEEELAEVNATTPPVFVSRRASTMTMASVPPAATFCQSRVEAANTNSSTVPVKCNPDRDFFVVDFVHVFLDERETLNNIVKIIKSSCLTQLRLNDQV